MNVRKKHTFVHYFQRHNGFEIRNKKAYNMRCKEFIIFHYAYLQANIRNVVTVAGSVLKSFHKGSFVINM